MKRHARVIQRRQGLIVIDRRSRILPGCAGLRIARLWFASLWLGCIRAAIAAVLIQGLIGALCQRANASQPHSMIGMYRSVRVRQGDTLHKIARRFGLNVEILASVNHVHNGAIHPGQRLTLPTLHILPAAPTDGIVLNIPEREVYLFREGVCIASFPVAIGLASWPTATGNFELTSRVVNPQWKPTRNMVERTLIQDEPVPPGPDNPVGDRWMGWSRKGYGFHSTTAPATIGKAASHGCVRLYPEAAHQMFELVKKGDKIYSLYEPVLIGRRGGRTYLSVFPDIYGRGAVSMDRVRSVLQQSVPLDAVDMDEVADIVRTQEGYPRPLHMRGGNSRREEAIPHARYLWNR